ALVEAAFDDVATAVADALFVAEVDRPTGLVAAMGDLVVAFGDGRGDGVLPQPGPVRLRRVTLVGEHPVRPRPGPAGAPGDADLGKRVNEHARVRRLSGREDEREGASFAVADQVILRRQPAAGAADRVIRRLRAELLVIRPSPLCPEPGSRRAGARARSSSRSTPPSPARHADASGTALSRTHAPRRPARTTG